MIQFIAADMDGTLLNNQQQLSPHLPAVIRQLHAKGIRFAIASGRQYYNLIKSFPDLKEDLIFIAENGGMIFDGTTLLHSVAISEEDLKIPYQMIQQIPGAQLIFCGAQSAYTDCTNDPIFWEHANRYYARLEAVPNLLATAQHDRICKIAVFLHKQAENILYPTLSTHLNAFQKVLSGDCWVDIQQPNTHKGQAIAYLQKHFSIPPEACMAFGDYPNDCEMMDAVYHSYAMANAHPTLASHCRFQAPSNEEDGVVQTLIQKFSLYIPFSG